MADNLNVTPGAGAVVAAKDIGGVLHQRSLTQMLVGGVPTDVSDDNPLPISRQDEIIYLLVAILEKMPRVDSADRMIIGNETTQTVSLASNQTVATLTDQTNVGGRSAANMAFAASNAGCMHIYNNITVS